MWTRFPNAHCRAFIQTKMTRPSPNDLLISEMKNAFLTAKPTCRPLTCFISFIMDNPTRCALDKNTKKNLVNSTVRDLINPKIYVGCHCVVFCGVVIMLCKLACEVWDLNRSILLALEAEKCFRCDIFPLIPPAVVTESLWRWSLWRNTKCSLGMQTNKQTKTISKAICIFRGVAKIWISTPRGLAEKSQHSTCCTLPANRNKLTEYKKNPRTKAAINFPPQRAEWLVGWKKWRRHQWAFIKCYFARWSIEIKRETIISRLGSNRIVMSRNYTTFRKPNCPHCGGWIWSCCGRFWWFN